jgi:cyclophilin family peptidyl-prolyl cis-trans isomerase
MKTVQQLLELTKNPFYKFTSQERAVLDDFLLKSRDTTTKKSRKKPSTASSKQTRATVRNIVKPVDTYPEELESF